MFLKLHLIEIVSVQWKVGICLFIYFIWLMFCAVYSRYLSFTMAAIVVVEENLSEAEGNPRSPPSCWRRRREYFTLINIHTHGKMLFLITRPTYPLVDDVYFSHTGIHVSRMLSARKHVLFLKAFRDVTFNGHSVFGGLSFRKSP